MAITFRRWRVLGRNKAELYLSVLPIPLVICALGKAPRGYSDDIVAVGGLLVASVLALNGLRDWGRMHLVERIIALPWALFLFCVTLLEIGAIVTVNGFADR